LEGGTLLPNRRLHRASRFRRIIRLANGNRRASHLACKHATGTLIAHWDDDDWYVSWRLSYQVGQLLEANADICGLDRVLFYAPKEEKVRAMAFDHARWLAEGDSRGIERIARDMGWSGDMPEPFAMASERRFDLPAGTVAIHPGCKGEWPWKKWHGFDELAHKFRSVVIVGTKEDLLKTGTYFQRDFEWPEQAHNFVGRLSLADTAALLRECAALVSNDSGFMHLAVALVVPTFGIFGITSPQREGMRSKNFYPITKGLPCEAACHAGTWGRRDCEYHLQCLKTLTAEEVFMKVTAVVIIRC
jgi:ADP-heptose:LPS heptosyltransferase